MHSNTKKNIKILLPDIDGKKNISKIIELDDSDYNDKLTALKLPIIQTNKGLLETLKKSGSNYFGNAEYKNMKHNLSNQSIEMQVSTHYSKNKMKNKMLTFRKDQFKEIKKNYVSPYNQKIMNNNLKIA